MSERQDALVPRQNSCWQWKCCTRDESRRHGGNRRSL